MRRAKNAMGSRGRISTVPVSGYMMDATGDGRRSELDAMAMVGGMCCEWSATRGWRPSNCASARHFEVAPDGSRNTGPQLTARSAVIGQQLYFRPPGWLLLQCHLTEGPMPPLLRSPVRRGAGRRPPLRRARALHLAPPFLLDSYSPRYSQLSEQAVAAKRAAAVAHLRHCNLCPRRCGVDRFARTGTCLIPAQTAAVSTIAPHFGEEACLQGWHGSGSVFFAGCNLRCVFCQNHDIAHRRSGFDLTPEQLADWMLQLQHVGRCHNVNLVTPEHVVPQVVLGVLEAAERGLRIPIVYNTSAYDSLESIELLAGIVDVYMPDFKVWEESTGTRLLKGDKYPETARQSIRAMHRQVGDLCFTADGLAKTGLLVRHLVMPGKEGEGRRIVEWLASDDGPGKDTFVHIMEQYRPEAHVGRPRRRTASSSGSVDARYNDINRHVSTHEVGLVRHAAEAAGLWRFEEPPKHGGWVA